MAIHTYPALKFADDREALVDGLLDGQPVYHGHG